MRTTTTEHRYPRLLPPYFGVILLMTSSLFGGCGRLFYYPDSILYYPPERAGYQHEDIHFAAADGTKLHGWNLKADARSLGGKAPKGTIIQFHGNAQNISSHYLSLAWLTRRGYDVFTFDYRGYGLSEGEPDARGTYLDGMAALDHAWELHEKSKAKKFVVFGQSLGGLVAMRAFADFRHQDRTTLVVMDSTFVSYKDMVQEKMAGIWLTWIFSPLGRFLVSDRYAAEAYMPKLRTRLLVIHDKRDPIVKFQNGRKLFGLATGTKEFWELDEAQHTGAFTDDSASLRDRFARFLESL